VEFKREGSTEGNKKKNEPALQSTRREVIARPNQREVAGPEVCARIKNLVRLIPNRVSYCSIGIYQRGETQVPGQSKALSWRAAMWLVAPYERSRGRGLLYLGHTAH
jgi:hypothetical protein